MASHATSPAPLEVEAVTDEAALPALAAEWEALVDERHPGVVFRSAAWLLPWWNAFSAGAPARPGRGCPLELRILIARRAGRLAGALPCFRAPGRWSRRLHLLGDNVVGSDYLGLIARPRDAEEVARALADPILP